MSGLGSKVATGFRWGVVANILIKASSFVMSLILARLLSPVDFGTYAIALAVSQLVIVINDGGLKAAAVHLHAGDERRLFSTVAQLSIAMSSALYVLVWFAAPFIASATDTPDATTLIRVVSAAIVFNGLAAGAESSLLKNFRQRQIAFASIAGFAVQPAIAITMAAMGAGALSFAVAQASSALVTAVVLIRSARTGFMAFDRSAARRLLIVGLPFAGAMGLKAILLNADYIVVGIYVATEQLGFYMLAFSVSSWLPGVLGTAIRYVSIPAFARASEQGQAFFARATEQVVPVLFCCVMPVAALIAVIANPLVAVLYGQRWSTAADVLALLILTVPARMFGDVVGEMMAGAGRTRPVLLVNVVNAVALVPALVAGTLWSGIQGAAIGQLVVAWAVVVPLHAVLLRSAGISLRRLLSVSAPALILAVVAAVVGATTTFLVAAPLLQLILGVVGSCALVALALVLFRRRFAVVVAAGGTLLGRGGSDRRTTEMREE